MKIEKERSIDIHHENSEVAKTPYETAVAHKEKVMDLIKQIPSFDVVYHLSLYSLEKQSGDRYPLFVDKDLLDQAKRREESAPSKVVTECNDALDAFWEVIKESRSDERLSPNEKKHLNDLADTLLDEMLAYSRSDFHSPSSFGFQGNAA